MVVNPVPAAHHRVCLTVAPVKPLTQSKWVAAKGKAASHPTTQPQAPKVMCIVSPTPEVAEVVVLIPPVTGSSWANHPSLFEGPVVLGDEEIGKEAPTMSCEYP